MEAKGTQAGGFPPLVRINAGETRQDGSLAQSVEQMAVNHQVPGSIPGGSVGRRTEAARKPTIIFPPIFSPGHVPGAFLLRQFSVCLKKKGGLQMKKYWREILLAIIVVFLVIPLSIAFSVSFRFICTDTSNEWIGFWGGYLGAIIGAVATIGGVRMTLREENKKRQAEEKTRENEIIEKRRLELMPYLTAHSYIPKESIAFSAGELCFVDFTDGIQIKDHFTKKYEDAFIEKKPEYYLLNYRIKNVGGGSAVGLYIKVNGNNVLWNGGLSTNSDITLSLLFWSEELQTKKIRIDLEYHDILNIGFYSQNEELEFYSENYEKMISLKKNSFLSSPHRIDSQG